MWLFESIAGLEDCRQKLAGHAVKKYSLRPLSSITHIAIHHSLTVTGSAEAFARYHVSTNGWPGIGYHFVIEQNGRIRWCHDPEVKSYHVGHSNSYALGVCLTGDFRQAPPTEAQAQSLRVLLKKLTKDLDVQVQNIRGHSEFPGYQWKECPCMDMPALRTSLSQRTAPVSRDEVIEEEPRRHLNAHEITALSRHFSHLSPGLIRFLNPQVARGPIVEEAVEVREQAPNFTRLPIKVKGLYESMKQAGYRVFEDQAKDYNLNIIGVRSSGQEVNVFNDSLHVIWKYNNRWSHWKFRITTDPGLHYLQNPVSGAGTAILKTGQYRGAYRLGRHRGKYEALVQVGPVTIIRDFDRDARLDFTGGREQTGIFGINIHRASSTHTSTQVDRWSAGCQVFADPGEFADFLKLCRLAVTNWGNSFTYTLLEDKA